MRTLSKTEKTIRLDSVRRPDANTLVFTFTCPKVRFFKKNEFFVRYSEPMKEMNEPLAAVIFAAVAAPVAQAAGAALVVPRLDEDFALSLEKISSYWRRIRGWGPLKLVAERVRSARRVSGAGMLFSGGIDSMASFIRNREKNLRLFVVLGADVPYSETTLIERLKRDFYDAFSKQEKTPLAYIHTDIRTALDEKALSNRFKVSWYGDIAHGLFLTSLVAPIAGLKDLLFASCSLAHPNGGCGGDLELMDGAAFAGTTVRVDLSELRRVEKIRKCLASNPRTHRFLRVCWEQYEKLNCGRCNKCLRTLCELLVNNIDPNGANFEMTDETLPKLKTRMMTSFYHFFHSESDLVFFRQIQDAIRLDEIKDIRGSRDFFEWLRDFSKIRGAYPNWYKKASYLTETLRHQLIGTGR